MSSSLSFSFLLFIFLRTPRYSVSPDVCIFLIFSPFVHRVPVSNPHISRCLFALRIDKFVIVVTVDRRPNDMPSTQTKRWRNTERERETPLSDRATHFRSPSKIENRRQKALHRNSLSILQKKVAISFLANLFSLALPSNSNLINRFY